MKQSRLILLFVLIVLFGSHVEAKEGEGDPFIKKEFYKKNITLKQFQGNSFIFYRSNAAMTLSVGYVGTQLGLPNLSNEEFATLLSDEKLVRTRICPTSEIITTGALLGDEFSWFDRNCRKDEPILQVRENEEAVWKDVLSLGCLNAVRDKTPVPPPVLTPPTVAEEGGKQYNVAELSVMQGSGVITYVPANAAVTAACNIETSTSGVFSSVSSSQKSLKKSVRHYDGKTSQGETP
jgi:hypothetical protein